MATRSPNFFILGWFLAKFYEWFAGQREVLLISLYAVTVFLFYAFFDLLPKMLFRANPNSFCLSAARIFRVINFLLSPLVLLVEEVSQAILRWTRGQTFTGHLFGNREELRAVMEESSSELSGDEHAMVNRILDLQHITVGQIARPLAETVTVATQTPLRDAVKLTREKGLSRLPVFEMRDGKQRVAGLLDVAPLLYRETL